MDKKIVGIDLGGTHLVAGLLINNRIVEEKTLKTPLKGKEIAEKIVETIYSLHKEPDAIGIGIPGVVFEEALVQAPNLPGLQGFPLKNFLKRRINSPFYIDNDANCATIGEKVFGRAKKFSDFIMLTLGTGVGGGIFLNGELYRGKTGGAGEIGHITIFPDGIPCNCGKKGCLESYASKSGLQKVLGENIEPEKAAFLARRGEKKYINAFSLMGKALGIAMGNLINVLDVQAFIFSGGISKSFNLFENELNETLDSNAFSSLLKGVEVLVSELEDRIGVLGACALAMRGGS